ncbi:anthranilate synthase component II [Symbiobacterium thermophilum]|uniref:Anthranilate/aminodeoxychorismate synthase component II n=1 Tax=Symbiobacterium thermophilum TaxID=2734 RepID=A0A953I3V1_SYMTR|nr:aminodeoxychorismate/anthranilate synthase component II [Symbiobacterium thermophilum]MBY6277907.1 anthranilate/aminodeoxychorismate synthase component II [Symbiobacterium thermophilum]
MIVVIDNYDSFTYNLVQCLGELGAAQAVFRNDQITVDQVAALRPEAVVISPGPCTPDEAGISLELIRRLGPTTPILGVCLGHQAIGQAYGGRVVPAPSLMHGKTSLVRHSGEGLFVGLPNPFTAGRYHSLVVDRASLPDDLVVTAETEDGLVMAVQHRVHPVYGVQFHPESILTECGRQLLQNFLRLAQPAAA